MTTRTLLPLAALALGAAGCIGPYAEVGQKLDLGVTLDGATTWVTGSGSEVKLLLLAAPSATGPIKCSSTTITGGVAVRTVIGSCDGNRDTRELVLTGENEYTLADERSSQLIRRAGSRRAASTLVDAATYRVEAGTLVVEGGAGVLAGRYKELTSDLAALGDLNDRAAACAFQVANLAVLSAQVRILGFNSAGMSQYLTPATFGGLLGGQLTVKVTGLAAPLATLTFSSFSDATGVLLDGALLTKTNLSGDGYMYGVVAVALAPRTPGTYAALPEVVGEITYGLPDGSGDSVRLANGNPVGGGYAVALVGGGSALVPAAAPSTPTAAECLGL